VVWSSASAYGHVGLSVIPNLWKYDLNFPCPVTIDVNSGDTESSCRSLFLTKGKKDLVTAPFSVLVHYCCHCLSPLSLTLVTITSLGILSYITGSSSTAAALASLSASSFPSIPECPLNHLKCMVHFECVSSMILFLMDSIRQFRLDLFCSKSRVILLSVYIATSMGNVQNVSQKIVTHLCLQPSDLALYLCSRTWELGYSFSHLSIHERRLLVWEQLCLETSPPEMCHSATHKNISETH